MCPWKNFNFLSYYVCIHTNEIYYPINKLHFIDIVDVFCHKNVYFYNYQIVGIIKFGKLICISMKKQNKQNINYYPSPLRNQYNAYFPTKDFYLTNFKDQGDTHKHIHQNTSKKIVKDHQPDTKGSKREVFLDGILLTNYQGNQWQKSGIFWMKNESFLLFNIPVSNKKSQKKQSNKNMHIITRKSYLIHPVGISVSASFSASRKHQGWMIGQVKNQFIQCNHYRKGVREGSQIFYDFAQKLLVVSFYEKNKLKDINAGVIGELQDLLQGQDQLLMRIKQLSQKNFEFPSDQRDEHQNFHKVVGMEIMGKKFNYYGQTCEQNLKQSHKNRQSGTNKLVNVEQNLIPNGFGILISQNDDQMYIGEFSEGILIGFGGIRFTNGDVYYGEIKNGMCCGYGRIRQRKNKKIYKYGHEDIEEKEFQQFLKIKFKSAQNQAWTEKIIQNTLEQKGQMFNQMIIFAQNLLQRSILLSKNADSENSHSKQLFLELQDEESQNFYFVPLDQTSKITPKLGNQIPKLQLKKAQNNMEGRKRIQTEAKNYSNIEGDVSEKYFKTDRQKNNNNISNIKVEVKNQHNIKNAQTFKSDPLDKKTKGKQKISKYLTKEPYQMGNDHRQFFKQESIGQREQYIYEQKGKNDPWYVHEQIEIQNPQNLKTKQKFKNFHNQQEKKEHQYKIFKKGDRPAAVNYGKVRKASSNISSNMQEDFIQKIHKN